MSVRRTIPVEVIMEHGRAHALEFEDGDVIWLTADNKDTIRRTFTRQAKRA